MLLACRTPMTCWPVTPAAAIARGSRVICSCGSSVPVRSALATPSSACTAGNLVGGDPRGRSKSVLIGRRDRGDDHRRGVDVESADARVDAGGQAQAAQVLLDRRLRLLDVGAELELGDQQGYRVGRRRLQMSQPRHGLDRALDRLGDLAGDVGRTGAGIWRDDGDDGEVDVGQQLLLERAPGADAGDEQSDREQQRDAALADGELGESTHWVSSWRSRRAAATSTSRARRTVAISSVDRGAISSRRWLMPSSWKWSRNSMPWSVRRRARGADRGCRHGERRGRSRQVAPRGPTRSTATR